jgi:hypothetical protein
MDATAVIGAVSGEEVVKATTFENGKDFGHILVEKDRS